MQDLPKKKNDTLFCFLLRRQEIQQVMRNSCADIPVLTALTDRLQPAVNTEESHEQHMRCD
jgi:hypothetical protein